MPRVVGDIDQLSDSVHRIVKSQAREKKSQAQKQADEMRERAREKGNRIRGEILADARSRAKQARRRLLAEAQQEVKGERLRAREGLLDQVWDRAEERLRELAEDDRYLKTLRRLARMAAETLGGGSIVLRADAEGHELLTGERLEEWGQAASDDLDVEVSFERGDQPLETWGGLVASSLDGKKRVDARFPTRLQTARSELRDEIYKMLVAE